MSTPQDRSLPPDRVEVWFVRTDDLGDEGLRAQYLALLDDEERERWARYRVEDAQLQYLASRALLRTMLATFGGHPAEGWRFAPSPGGRPEISGPVARPRLRFNLSHTRGLVACGLAAERDLGLDLEVMAPGVRAVELARRYYSEAEARTLEALPAPAEREARFYALWTLKEAYAKGRGEGLALPLDSASFELRGELGLGVRIDPALGDPPAGWSFTLLEPEPGYRAALAVRQSTADVATTLRCRRVVPLVGADVFEPRVLATSTSMTDPRPP